MTRTEALIQYLTELTNLPAHAVIDFPAHAATIQDLCKGPAEYLSMGDFAKRIGRNATTIHSWLARGQHDIPPALGKTGNGPIWDAADIDTWALAHPGLCIRAGDNGVDVGP